MRALITGVAGFAGSHLARHLRASGDQVLGVVHEPSDMDAASTDPQASRIPAADEILVWDIRRAAPPNVARSIQQFRPDAVYHLAAISVPGACGDDEPAPLALATNVEGTRNVAQLAASLATPPRLLFSSSSHVYAPIESGWKLLNEEATVGPRRAYGKTKWLAEQVLSEFFDRLPCLVARSFNHTGPGQRGPLLLPEWAMQFAELNRNTIDVISLDAFLDLSDVRDVVRAYRLLVGAGQAGETYNVGSGHATRSGQVMELLKRVSGRDVEVRESSPGRRDGPIADTARLQAATDWQPEISLEQTVDDFWLFHITQQDGRTG